MASRTYRCVVGNYWTITGTFVEGDPAADEPDYEDPTEAILTITAPDGTVTTPEVTRASQGIYTYDLLIDQVGTWQWDWQGTGNITAQDDTQWLTARPKDAS